MFLTKCAPIIMLAAILRATVKNRPPEINLDFLTKQDLLINWFADKILYELKDVDYANDILIVAEEKIKYQKANQDAV